MKYIYIGLFLILLISMGACNKEVLKVVDEPIEINEKDPEYQVFLEERIREYIKLYRFEKATPFLDGITDPETKAAIMKELADTKAEARTQGFGFIIESGDTLFYRNPGTAGDPNAVTNLIINLYSRAAYKINVAGKFYGLERYPNLQSVVFNDCLATEVVGLDKLKHLTAFAWNMDVRNMKEVWELEEVEPAKIKLDLSGNSELQKLHLNYIELTENIQFPNHKLELLDIKSSVINTDDVLNNLWAKKVDIVASAKREDLVISAKNIDTLFLHIENVLNLADFSASNLNALSFRGAPKKIRLNEGLKAVNGLNARNLIEKIDFPAGIENLSISNYTIDADFSHLNSLESFSLDVSTDNDYTAGVPITYELSRLQLPSSVKYLSFNASGYYRFDLNGLYSYPSAESLYIFAPVDGGLLLSGWTSLKELELYITDINGELKLPPTIEKLKCFNSVLNVPELDLSQLTNIQYLYWQGLGKDNPVVLTLPPNFSEQALIAVGTINGRHAYLNLKTGSTIINKPAWLDEYLEYYD